MTVRITRTRTTTSGKTSRETTYLITSLHATDAQPADLQHWARAEWLIENQLHHVRDVTFREDHHQARTGTGPAVMATLRNTAIGWHRINGEPDIARATRHANRRPHDLQGYCLVVSPPLAVGFQVVTASISSCGRWLARRGASAMLAAPAMRWNPIAVLRSVAKTAGPLAVRA
ncbi:hypothetical protein ABT336_02360 [Micromonospora sp. NPDC000207]|uniref:hypothetical protein n=1 Tax=Micromonospora sp. NPDC000207 TaxID=3154246 RepID=UPI0033195AA0